MTILTKLLAASVLVGTVAVAAPASATGTIYTSRTAFEAALGRSLTDDFGAAYGSGFSVRSNAAMSAVLNQTTFQSTAYTDLNIVSGGRYCAGCNGSFTLGFAATSFGTAAGVFGVGADLVYSSGYTAFVTYGDGSTENVATPVGSSFFGITSTTGVKSIAYGLANGGTTTGGSFSIDNLTIGASAVPEPASWAMMIVGIGAVGATMRRRRTRTTVRFA
jgi:hypothetical protein